MDYTFLVDTYASERLKTLSVWAMFDDTDLDVRPHPNLARDRTFREHMVHQCLSEDKWFTGMFGVDVGAPPLAAEETRLAFIRRYAEDSARRLARLGEAALVSLLGVAGINGRVSVPRLSDAIKPERPLAVAGNGPPQR